MSKVNDWELVVLRADNRPAEDESYIIGAIWLNNPDEAAFNQLQQDADNLRSTLIEEIEDYQDNQLLEALAEHGYRLADPPTEMIVG